MRKFNVAIVGATGAVGETFLEILKQRDFPLANLYALASERSEGRQVQFGDEDITVTALDDFDFSQVDFAFFSAGSSVSKTYAPKAAEAGAIVIDNTSCFRYESDIPLVVPEVNPQALENFRDRNIIANPNCSTIQLVMVLKPIHDEVGIERVNVATYQAVSGAGRRAVEELAKQTAQVLNGEQAESEVFKHQIAFNCFPGIDRFEDNGYTFEEMKMNRETKKILGDDRIEVNATCVRIPVFYGHSEAVHLETMQPISVEEVRALLENMPGVAILPEKEYPTAVSHAMAADEVFVGRLRKDISHPNGINLWIVADNIRKGAALNAVQIAEYLIEREMV